MSDAEVVVGGEDSNREIIEEVARFLIEVYNGALSMRIRVVTGKTFIFRSNGILSSKPDVSSNPCIFDSLLNACHHALLNLGNNNEVAADFLDMVSRVFRQEVDADSLIGYTDEAGEFLEVDVIGSFRESLEYLKELREKLLKMVP